MPKKSSSKNKLKITYGENELQQMGKYGALEQASKGMKAMGKVKCNDCPTPEICAKKGCQREAVNKNFMGSKGKPIELDIDF